MNAKHDISQLPASLQQTTAEKLTIEIPPHVEEIHRVAINIVGRGYWEFPLACETTKGFIVKTNGKENMVEEWFAKDSTLVKSRLL